jgi:hypothetical protein
MLPPPQFGTAKNSGHTRLLRRLDRAGGIGYASLFRHHSLAPVWRLGCRAGESRQRTLRIVPRAEVAQPALDFLRPLAVVAGEQRGVRLGLAGFFMASYPGSGCRVVCGHGGVGRQDATPTKNRTQD